MAAPTNTYCDYATGNDYKGATFTDGAYTSATKTLVKLNAFAATKVNHWLYLESNDGGSIVAGYYKVATWTDASTVILATDAGAGVDDDAAKCTQHDGTTSLPWRSVQGALDLITRDATNGDQINVKAGTAQVNQAALTLATYGTPAESAPLILRGYTTTAGDGGIGEIDANGATMYASNPGFVHHAELLIHNFGNNDGIVLNSGNPNYFYRCEVHKGASSPSSKALIRSTNSRFIGCWIHDSGTSGIGLNYPAFVFGCYLYNHTTGGQNSGIWVGNIFVDCLTGINMNVDGMVAIGNSFYSSSTSNVNGINIATGASHQIILNNIFEGFSGTGDEGINALADIAIIGYNAFYNNTAAKNVSDILIDLGGDQTLTASPFVNPGAGDFSLKDTGGALETAWPGAWYGPASTTNKADMGAVQKGAGVSGPPGWL